MGATAMCIRGRRYVREGGMQELSVFYFSGTGNTKYAVNALCKALSPAYTAHIYDVCKGELPSQTADTVLLAFPVYGSAPPIPMRQFVHAHAAWWKGKTVIVIVTQYMFSGDGAASLGRTVQKYGGNVRYAEHFRMPNNISDCPVFAVRNGEEAARLVRKTDARIQRFAQRILEEKPMRRGFSAISRAVGYVSQRALYRKHEAEKRDRVTVDAERCVSCGACVRACPVQNLRTESQKVYAQGACVLCYRCVNLCPQKAITVLGKKAPRVQYKGVPQ